ncbi:MAG: MBL fold metallo-hydrolase [Planctomycetota bacterium]
MKVRRIAVGPLECNCYVVYDPETCEAAIIDPGGDAGKIINICSAEGLSPLYLIATHAHADHIGALPAVKEEYPEARLCLGQNEIDTYNDSLSNLTHTVGLKLTLPEPDQLLAEGDTVEFGSVILKVIHTPGHTRGSISLLAEGEEPAVVFCGDLVFRGGVGRTDLPGGDRESLRASIKEKILTLPPQTIVMTGHDQRTTVENEMNTMDYS